MSLPTIIPWRFFLFYGSREIEKKNSIIRPFENTPDKANVSKLKVNKKQHFFQRRICIRLELQEKIFRTLPSHFEKMYISITMSFLLLRLPEQARNHVNFHNIRRSIFPFSFPNRPFPYIECEIFFS